MKDLARLIVVAAALSIVCYVILYYGLGVSDCGILGQFLGPVSHKSNIKKTYAAKLKILGNTHGVVNESIKLRIVVYGLSNTVYYKVKLISKIKSKESVANVHIARINNTSWYLCFVPKHVGNYTVNIKLIYNNESIISNNFTVVILKNTSVKKSATKSTVGVLNNTNMKSNTNVRANNTINATNTNEINKSWP